MIDGDGGDGFAKGEKGRSFGMGGGRFVILERNGSNWAAMGVIDGSMESGKAQQQAMADRRRDQEELREGNGKEKGSGT